MIEVIKTQQDFIPIMNRIEQDSTKATRLGGFSALSNSEAEELHRLSFLVEHYEKAIGVFPAQ